MKRKIGSFLVAVVVAWQLDACGHVPNPATRVASGDIVATNLNARFYDTRMSCPGATAAYYCTGVLIRVAGASEHYHAWNPNPDAGISSVSFSYLRDDVGSRTLYGDASRPNGFVFGPAEVFGTGNIFPLTIRCAFPYDGVTGLARAPEGCQGSMKDPDPSRPPEDGTCLGLGITTVEAWLEHFRSVTGIPARYSHQCAFRGDRAAFELALRSRVDWEQEFELMQHMEVMVSVWPQDIPQQLPIEAIFYTVGGEDGLENARFIQADLANTSGKVVPIVRFSTEMTLPPFSYDAADQAWGLRH